MIRVSWNNDGLSFWDVRDRESACNTLHEAGFAFASCLNGRMGTTGRTLIAADVRDFGHIVSGFASVIKGRVSYAPFWFRDSEYFTSIIEPVKIDTLVILSPVTINPIRLSAITKVAIEKCSPKKIVVCSVIANAILQSVASKVFRRKVYAMTDFYYMDVAIPGVRYNESVWRDDEDLKHVPKVFFK